MPGPCRFALLLLVFFTGTCFAGAFAADLLDVLLFPALPLVDFFGISTSTNLMGPHHNWLAAAGALGFTVVTASLSYTYFKKPILRLKRHLEVVKTTAQ